MSAVLDIYLSSYARGYGQPCGARRSLIARRFFGAYILNASHLILFLANRWIVIHRFFRTDLINLQLNGGEWLVRLTNVRATRS